MPILFLFLVAFLVVTLVLPIVALVRSSDARDRAKRLDQLVSALRSDLRRLERQVTGSTPSEPVPESRANADRPTSAAVGGQSESEESQAAQQLPPPVRPPRPSAPSPTSTGSPSRVGPDWERFTGGRLFSWIGGLALFLGMLFLVKYSVDQGLLSPGVRIVGSLTLGLLCIGAGLRFWSTPYKTTARTLCGVGPAVLYLAVFAAHSFYNMIGAPLAFAAMILVTVGVILLADQLESRYIALLGLAGGFLTPPALSTGQDNPLALFGYLAFLDVGLAVVASRRRWGLLIPISAVATALTQIGWLNQFFAVEKVMSTIAVLQFFAVLFALFVVSDRRASENTLIRTGVGGMSIIGLLHCFWMLSDPELGSQPILVFSLVLGLNLVLMGLVLLHERYGTFYWAGNGLTFLLLLSWTLRSVTEELLITGLVLFLVFGALQALFSILLSKWRPLERPKSMAVAFPALMLLVLLTSLVAVGDTPLAAWPFVLFLDALAVIAALASGLVWVVGATLVLTVVLLLTGIAQLETSDGLVEMLSMVVLFSVAFLASGQLAARIAERGNGKGTTLSSRLSRLSLEGVPALSSLYPFVLLISSLLRLRLEDPSPVFGFGLLMLLLSLGFARYFRRGWIAPVALLGVVLVELTWHLVDFTPDLLEVTLPWYLILWVVSAGFPFLFRRNDLPMWLVSALTGPVHFFLIFDTLPLTRGDLLSGLLSVSFAAIYLGALLRARHVLSGEGKLRSTVQALFGGVSLFFVSLTFPILLEREWLTVGWALEGAALLWLFSRIPHPSLKKAAFAFLMVAFVRLALNPAVLTYHPPTGMLVLNWYLYVYGTVILCLVLCARLWRPAEQKVAGLPVVGTLTASSGILAFLLVNIEIADFFSQGSHLAFRFGASVAQDMTYSLAWGLFGLGLMVIGIAKSSRYARLSALGLLLPTVLKLFLYDLWSLGQLYRVVAFVSLAVVLMSVSFLYQRYVGNAREGRRA